MAGGIGFSDWLGVCVFLAHARSNQPQSVFRNSIRGENAHKVICNVLECDNCSDLELVRTCPTLGMRAELVIACVAILGKLGTNAREKRLRRINRLPWNR